MNIYGTLLAAYRAFCQDSSHFTKHQAQEMLKAAVEEMAEPGNDKFIAHFVGPDGKYYTTTLTGHELVTHLDAKFKHCKDHRLIAVVPHHNQ